jgi:hypothetical protein
MPLALAALDWLLTAVHLALVCANLFLWLPRRTRRLHLVLVGATALSWFGLGYFYGLGYCFLTDWQWQVKVARGASELPHSFIYYVLVDGLGLPMSREFVDTTTAVAFGLVIALSVTLNLRDRRHTRSRLA